MTILEAVLVTSVATRRKGLPTSYIPVGGVSGHKFPRKRISRAELLFGRLVHRISHYFISTSVVIYMLS
jgi:hypothetical protein